MRPPWRKCRRAFLRLKREVRNLPWSLLIAAAILLLFGWLGICRYESLHRTSFFFLKRQLAWSALAIGVALILGFGPWNRSSNRLRAWAYPIYGLSLVLLVAVFFFPSVNGAHRWIRVGPIGFQPSELAKPVVVLALARYLTQVETRRWRDLLGTLALIGPPMLLVIAEPDLGTALVFAPVLLAMLFFGGVKKRQLVTLVLIAFTTAPVLWTGMSREQRSRVTALFEEISPDRRPSDDAYHLYQARRTFAFGGVWGSWLGGNAVDDLDAFPLPEGQGDFILCSVAERFGLMGIGIVFAAYAVFVHAGLRIAAASEDPFARLSAAGLVTIVAVQVVVNAGMLAGLLPVTGLPLPLMSYGGSSLIVQGLSIGLLVRFARRPTKRNGADAAQPYITEK